MPELTRKKLSTDSKYLEFVRLDLAGRKTPIVTVHSRREALLGTIRWYGPWRQFCFYPEPATIFNVGCMNDIESVIADLKGERDA